MQDFGELDKGAFGAKYRNGVATLQMICTGGDEGSTKEASNTGSLCVRTVLRWDDSTEYS